MKIKLPNEIIVDVPEAVATGITNTGGGELVENIEPAADGKGSKK